MKKIEQIQQRKLVSAYGGVGSIIETASNGSLLIDTYDHWPCFSQQRMEQANEGSVGKITDDRLLDFLRRNGYQHLTRLVPIPTDEINLYAPRALELQSTIQAEYFPKWFYCPYCRRLHKFETWRTLWEQRFPRDNRFKKNFPACYNCSKQNERGVNRTALQQVRFVMASLESGELKDIPFDEFFYSQPIGGVWGISRQRNSDELYYRTSSSGDGLNTICIENRTLDQRVYISAIANCYIVSNNKAYRLELRGSQSLYFPAIIRSIYIPVKNANIGLGLDIQEFRFITDDANFVDDKLIRPSLIVKRKNSLRMSLFVNRISSIDRLKETSALVYYTRMDLKSKQWYDPTTQSIRDDVEPGKIYPINADSEWMPAVEAYGEGILIEVDVENIVADDRELFVHTFCHIVMKELEFQCGYPLTSLKEKIYIDNNNGHAGFLIYTVAGSEGSYGGLVSLTNSDKIVNLIERGCKRAKDCPNDPICINEAEHHCYACLDLPETSCCQFNKNLDRKLFLDYYEQ